MFNRKGTTIATAKQAIHTCYGAIEKDAELDVASDSDVTGLVKVNQGYAPVYLRAELVDIKTKRGVVYG